LEIIIELLPEITEYKKNEGSNINVTVPLATIWDELKQYGRFCVVTTVYVPVFIKGEKRSSTQQIIDYYTPLDVIDPNTEPYVMQAGFYEGLLDKSRTPHGSASVWGYYLLWDGV